MNKKDCVGEILISIGILAAASAIVALDYKNSEWNCHYCGETFKAPFREYFFAGHTPRRRNLCCPVCGNKGYFKVVKG